MVQEEETPVASELTLSRTLGCQTSFGPRSRRHTSEDLILDLEAVEQDHRFGKGAQRVFLSETEEPEG